MVRKVHVCLVAPLPPPVGGIAQWTVQLLKTLGVRADVRVSHVNTALLGRRIDDVRVVRRIVVGVRQLGGQLWGVARALKQRPDALHLTTSGDLGLVRDACVLLLCRLSHIPALYHLRFGRVPDLAKRRNLEWWLLVRCIRLAKAVVTLDRSTERVVSTIVVDTIVKRIPNLIDTAPVRHATAIQETSGAMTEKHVLFLGWVLPSKGVEDLIAAWDRVGADGWNLLIAGPVHPEYEAQLRTKRTGKCVTLLGEVSHDEALALIAKCEIFCLPSHSEGFPNVILEAMATGKPVIATRVGAIPEMLANDCGELLEPRDIDGLSATLRRLIDNPDLRAQLGQRARFKVDQEYRAETVIQTYVDVWRECAESA